MGMASGMPEAVPLVRANGSRRGNMRPRASISFDIGGADHLAPFFGFIRDQLAEVGGRAGERRAVKGGEPRLHFRIGERRIDLLV